MNIPIKIRTSFGYTNALLAQFESSLDVINHNEHLDLALELGWERVMPEKESQSIFPISQKISLGTNLNLDYLDFNYNPRKGIYYQVQLSYATQKNQTTSSYTPPKNQNHNLTSLIKLQNFIPTFPNQCLMISTNFTPSFSVANCCKNEFQAFSPSLNLNFSSQYNSRIQRARSW